MHKALVNKIIRFSSVDGPGNRTVIFLQGCNFNCKYCHNPETIGNCKHCGICIPYCKAGAITLKDGRMQYDISKCVHCDECFHHCPYSSSPKTISMSAEQVMDEVRRNMPFIRGITVSGGECTRWRDFLVDLLQLAKNEGLTTMLDSNGTYDFSQDEELLEVMDSVMLDIKAYGKEEHRVVTEQDNEVVLSNMEFLASIGKLFEVRTVVVPELFDAEDTITQVAKKLKEYHSIQPIRYKIIKYRPIGVRKEYADYSVPSDEWMIKLSEIAKLNGFTDVIII